MANLGPNDPCPCGSDAKFKKCCLPYLQGLPVEHPDRLLRARYAALVKPDARFLWETLHPSSPRKLKDTWMKFEREHDALKKLDYRGLRVIDADLARRDRAVFVQWVQVEEAGHDLSYVEESVFQPCEGRWYYFDGLRRSAARLGCLPESVKIGELATLFVHESRHN